MTTSDQNGGAYVKSEPRVSAAEKDLEVFRLGEVVPKVFESCLGRFHTLNDGIVVSLRVADGEDVVDVRHGLLDVTLDVHSVTRGLWDCEAEVKSDARGHATETWKQVDAFGKRQYDI